MQKRYVDRVIEAGGTPLPVMNRINEKGELFLLQYKLYEKNINSLAICMDMLVPRYLRKLYLVENQMSD